MLIPLAPEAIRHLKKGGIMITSGILDIKEDAVAEAMRLAGFEIIEITRQKEWVSVTARK